MLKWKKSKYEVVWDTSFVSVERGRTPKSCKRGEVVLVKIWGEQGVDRLPGSRESQVKHSVKEDLRNGLGRSDPTTGRGIVWPLLVSFCSHFPKFFTTVLDSPGLFPNDGVPFTIRFYPLPSSSPSYHPSLWNSPCYGLPFFFFFFGNFPSFYTSWSLLRTTCSYFSMTVSV